MTTIIDGKKIRDDILNQVREGIAALPFVPVFCDILVGSDPVSLQYVRMKAKAAASVGIEWREALYPESITTEELVAEVHKLNTEPRMCGLIIQLPLPTHIDRQQVLDAIDPAIDVDCLSQANSALFYSDRGVLGYPTALACVHLLESLDLNRTPETSVVILGQGQLVGRPVTHLLRRRGYAVVTITTTTLDKEQMLKSADVIISAIGEPGFLKGAMIRSGAIVIDAGTSEETDAVVGDVDAPSVEGVASILSPVPGGVGPVTVAMLLKNVLIAAQKK